MSRLSELLAAAHGQLKDAGIGGAGLDARLLMEAATGLNAAAQISRSDSLLDDGTAERFNTMIARRLDHEPVGRIIGKKEFWGLPFCLNDATLVPRPDSETLVEVVLSALAETRQSRTPAKPLTLCDLGTGSGAILIALLSELPNATGVGIDISEQAIRAARENAVHNGVSDRSSFITGDYATTRIKQVSVLVANPPYIPSADLASLQKEVKHFDPHLALDGGSDGLDAYRTIASRLRDLLMPDGLLALEVGIRQAEEVQSILKRAGRPASNVHRDLSGMERVVLSLPEC